MIYYLSFFYFKNAFGYELKDKLVCFFQRGGIVDLKHFGVCFNEIR